MRPRRPFAAAPETARRTAAIGLALAFVATPCALARGSSGRGAGSATSPDEGRLGHASSVESARAGKTYRLDRASTYQTGCFPPCFCPISDPASLRGVFRLKPGGSSGGYDLFRITDIQWRGIRGGNELVITGSGTYRIAREGIPSHQLVLDLAVGDRPIERYDSGIVAAESDFPRIDIHLHLHGGRCLDTAIGVRSQPLAVLISDRGGENAPRPFDDDPGDTATAP